MGIAFYLPLLFVIVGTVFYDLLGKTLPRKVNPFLYLVLTYLVASTVLLVFLMVAGYDFRGILSDFNVQSVLVGGSAMFVDLGLILAYRSGWKLSNLNISYTVSVLVILAVIGIVFLGERITLIKIVGCLLCLVSIVLMNAREFKKKERK